MKQPETIWQELEQISPLLASIDRRNFYSVPDGYFEKNAVILSFLSLEDPSISIPAIKPVYAVPEGYFEQFSEKLVQQIRTGEAAAELQSFALLSTVGKRALYDAPADYFQSFYPKLWQRITAAAHRKKPSLLHLLNLRLNAAFDQLGQLISGPKIAWVTASFLGLAMVCSIYFLAPAMPLPTAQLDTLTEQEISQYIAMNSDEFNDERLITGNTNAIDVIGGFENTAETNARMESFILREADAETIKEWMN